MSQFCVHCYRCGVVVESPQARNEKHQWLCCTCWQAAEDERRASADNGPAPIGPLAEQILGRARDALRRRKEARR